MTDRELLELAAKAAGIKLDWSGKYFISEDFGVWRPIDDDGDALRLFCSFPSMTLNTSEFGVSVRERGNKEGRDYAMWTEWIAENNGDKAAATRRAIVRAAAEIGRSLSADRDAVA